MRPDDEERHRKNLEHARWRVAYFRSILASHRRVTSKWRDRTWKEKEDLYSKRLLASEQELKRLESL